MESGTKTRILSISAMIFVGALSFGSLGYMLGAVDPTRPEAAPRPEVSSAELARLRQRIFLQQARIDELEALLRELGHADRL